LSGCCGLNLVLVQIFKNWFNFYFLLLCIHYPNLECSMANKIETNSKNFKPRINLNHNMDIHAKVISGLGLEIVKWFCLLEEKNEADTMSFFPVIKLNKTKKNKQLNSCRHFVVGGTGWQGSDLTFNSLRPCPVIFPENSLHFASLSPGASMISTIAL